MLWVDDPVAGSDQSWCRNRWPEEPSLSRVRPTLSGPRDPGRIPAEPPGGSVGARYDPRRDGVAGQADAVGIRPGRKATASLHGRAGRLVVETHP